MYIDNACYKMACLLLGNYILSYLCSSFNIEQYITVVYIVIKSGVDSLEKKTPYNEVFGLMPNLFSIYLFLINLFKLKNTCYNDLK